MADPQQDQVTNLHISNLLINEFYFSVIIHLGSLDPEPFGWEENIHYICCLILPVHSFNTAKTSTKLIGVKYDQS